MRKSLILISLVFSFILFLSFVNAQTVNYGAARLRSYPITGIQVYIDGVPYNQNGPSGTAVGLNNGWYINNIPAGSHTFRFAKPNYLDVTYPENITAGMITYLDVALTAINDTIVNPSYRNAGIFARSTIYTAVYVDNKFKGNTYYNGLIVTNLTVGSHSVNFSSSGYKDLILFPYVLNGRLADAGAVPMKLNQTYALPFKGALVFDPYPAVHPINIYVDGAYIGDEPFYIVDSGWHTIRFTKEGYNTVVVDKKVNEFMITDVGVLMIPLNQTQQVTYTCSDSDNGLNYNQQGTTTIIGSNGAVTQTKTDFCSNSKTLTEYYCSSTTTISFKSFTCKGSCIDGACSVNIAYSPPENIQSGWVIGITLTALAGFLVITSYGKLK